jgi:hypothetical protein
VSVLHAGVIIIGDRGFEESESIEGRLAAAEEASSAAPRSPTGTIRAMDQDHRTEAACLLEQGAQYRKRVGLEPVADVGSPIFAGFKPAAFSLYFGDAPIYHFDREGRWQRAFVEGIHYLKGLDGSGQAIDRVREGANLVLRRRPLDSAEAGAFDDRVRSVALELRADLEAGRLRRREPPVAKAQPLATDELGDFLGRIAGWDGAAWSAQRGRFLATYGLFPFLPPDCQNGVVVQATLGHAHGRTFGLGLVAEHSVRTQSDFQRHAREVAALWGRRLLQSRVVFLAGSDVLHLAPAEVAAYLETIGHTFPISPPAGRGADNHPSPDEASPRLDGVHTFLDDFVPPLPDPAAWGELAARGLVRISLGVESGAREVRAAYGKSWSDDQLRAAVGALKAAGLGASVLTLVGAGGVERAESHVRGTTRLIESLDLGRGDFVFLLDENELRDPAADLEGLTPLSGAAWSEQQARLKEALAPLKGRGIKVLPYTLEKQCA